MAEVVCLGEVLIDFVPTVTPTTLIEAPAFKKAPGGAPANVAVGLARLGIGSAFLGMTGDDPFGHFLEQTLREAGVDTRWLRFTADARTALAFVSLRADGEREFTFYRHPSADMLLRPEDVDAAAFTNAKVLHVGSISLIAEPSASATRVALARARAAGCLISCDPNLRLALWPDPETARAGLLEAVAAADVVKISDDELNFLFGTDDPAEARSHLLAPHHRLIVITYGARGCVWLTHSAEGRLPGFVVEAVEATGAGDGFTAGLLAGLLDRPDAPLHDARLDAICRFACAVGAITTTVRGAIPALPDRATVERFLEQHG
jgi:fructokinase